MIPSQHDRRRLIIQVTVVLCTLIVFFVAQRPSETRLLEKATSVTKLPANSKESFVMQDGTILAVQVLDQDHCVLSHLQAKTGTVITESRLDPAYTSGSLSIERLFSPDGRTFLWAQHVAEGNRWVVFEIASGRYSTFPVSAGDSMDHPSAAWSMDSSQIIEIAGNTGKQRLVWHSVRDPQTPQVYDLPETPDRIWMVGAKSKDSVILETWEGLYEVTCREAKLTYKEIDKPGGSNFIQKVVSPTGKYCAWVTYFHPYGIWGKPIDDLLKQPGARQLAVYVGKTGHVQIDFVGALPPDSRSDTQVDNLRWTSDERGVTFEHEGSLYVVPCR